MVERRERKPTLSVVVVIYNMSREAPRTLHSLSAAYQRHIDPDDYEVIVVDNGSSPPFDQKILEASCAIARLTRERASDEQCPQQKPVSSQLACPRGAAHFQRSGIASRAGELRNDFLHSRCLESGVVS